MPRQGLYRQLIDDAPAERNAGVAEGDHKPAAAMLQDPDLAADAHAQRHEPAHELASPADLGDPRWHTESQILERNEGRLRACHEGSR
jgi:hypothetical protein